MLFWQFIITSIYYLSGNCLTLYLFYLIENLITSVNHLMIYYRKQDLTKSQIIFNYNVIYTNSYFHRLVYYFLLFIVYKVFSLCVLNYIIYINYFVLLFINPVCINYLFKKSVLLNKIVKYIECIVVEIFKKIIIHYITDIIKDLSFIIFDKEYDIDKKQIEYFINSSNYLDIFYTILQNTLFIYFILYTKTNYNIIYKLLFNNIQDNTINPKYNLELILINKDYKNLISQNTIYNIILLLNTSSQNNMKKILINNSYYEILKISTILSLSVFFNALYLQPLLQLCYLYFDTHKIKMIVNNLNKSIININYKNNSFNIQKNFFKPMYNKNRYKIYVQIFLIIGLYAIAYIYNNYYIFILYNILVPVAMFFIKNIDFFILLKNININNNGKHMYL